MEVIAHRGCNREALENSWDAFDRAISCGSQRIELDLQLTADGDVVINHDDSLLKTTGVDASISRLTRREIAKIPLKNGEPIPFLDEVLERLLPRIELNLELKGNSPELASRVAAQVARLDLVSKIIISAFEAPPLLRLLDEAPHVRRACLWGRDSFTWPYFATFAPNIFLDTCQTNILHPDVRMVDANLMDQAHARGWIVYPWVPMAGEEDNKEDLWAWLKTLGVHGLCTNYPRQFKIWNDEAGMDAGRFAAADQVHLNYENQRDYR